MDLNNAINKWHNTYRDDLDALIESLDDIRTATLNLSEAIQREIGRRSLAD